VIHGQVFAADAFEGSAFAVVALLTWGILERNRLKSTVGDAINAILSAAAMNFQKLQSFSRRSLLRLLDQLHHAIDGDPITSAA
jgi:hypothetical protein